MARSYYLPDEKKSFGRKTLDLIFKKPVPPFPKTIVIETQFGCNASCLFCQYPQVKDRLPKGKMDMDLFGRIARECHGKPVERFILCLDNEPLLDVSLAKRFELLRSHCPSAARNLTTNASLLTPDRVEELIGSGLVNEIFFSINGYSKEVYEELMGLNFERTMGNLDLFCHWLREHPGIREKLRVRVNVLRTRRIQPEWMAMRTKWKDHEGFEFHTIEMDNRGNQLHIGQDSPLASDKKDLTPFKGCRRPFHTFVITWEGKAVICCADYLREVVLGDLGKESIESIWNGPRATKLRMEMLSHDLRNLKPCQTCQIKK